LGGDRRRDRRRRVRVGPVRGREDGYKCLGPDQPWRADPLRRRRPPTDPTDDFYGFLGTSIFGEGRARLSIGRSFSSAKGTATVRAQVATVNECTGGSEVTSSTDVAVVLDLTGLGPVVTEKGRTTIAIPKQLRTKIFVQSRSREAAGTVKVDGRTLQVGGLIGELSLRGMLITR
jgi:hypothetical protein